MLIDLDLAREFKKKNIIDSDVELSIGFFSEARYENGDYVASVAFTNEFGDASKRIPARPFFRNTIKTHSTKWGDIFAKQAKQGNAKGALNYLGNVIKGDIQKSITDLRTPPNAPLTIAMKGSSNPLIDTGFMRASVTYKIDEVKDKK